MSNFGEQKKIEWVKDVYGEVGIQDLNRLQYPVDGDPTDLVEAIENQRQLARVNSKNTFGGFTVLADGAFDVPHPAHERFLRHVRALAGAAILANQSEVVSPQQVRRVISGDDVTVVVTVDADSKVARKKSGLADKGGVERPIYPWITRAERVLGHTFDIGHNKFKSVVDIATVEGDDLHQGTPFESSMKLAGYLHKSGVLNNVVLSAEHPLMIEEARDEGLDPIVLPIESRFLINPQTGNPWSSSNVIDRAKGSPVQFPITRPEHLFVKNGSKKS